MSSSIVYLCGACEAKAPGRESLTIGTEERSCDGGCGARIGYTWGPPDARGVQRRVLVAPFFVHWKAA
jgi:hypothetical protein